MSSYYAQMSRRRWETLAPKRTAALENPEEFFSLMGEQIETAIASTYPSLLQQSRPSSQYLTEVGRQSAARKQAEEYALAQMEWPEPELTETDQRAEWESNRPAIQALEAWAWTVDGEPDQQRVEQLAETYCLTPDFVTALGLSENPTAMLEGHEETIQQATEAAWTRHQREQQ